MGWTYTYKPKGVPVTEFLIDRGVLWWTGETARYAVLDSALIRMRELYVAIERVDDRTGERKVFAGVILIDFKPKDEYNFGWKDMGEDEGPYYYDCPEKILKLLTPTDNEHAKGWREACWKKVHAKKARPKIKEGVVLRYGGRDYTVVKTLGRKGYEVVHAGWPYRLKTTQAAKAEVVHAVET